MFNIVYKRKIFYIFLAFTGAFLVLLNTWEYGNGVTDDSVNYLYAGLNFMELNGLFNYNGTIYTNWPPLYPMTIFIISIFSNDMFSSIVFLNSVLFFLTILLSGKIAELYLKGSFGKILFSAILTFSYPMLFVFTRIWTEPIFILLTLYIFFVDKTSKRRFNFILFIAFIIIILTRYIGLAILAAYILHKIKSEIKLKNEQKKITIIKFSLFYMISVSPLVLWFLRNVILKNEITTLNYNLPNNIIFNLYRFFDSISILFIPESFYEIIRLIVIFVFLAVSVIIIKKFSIKILDFEFIKYYIIIYSAFLIILSTLYKFEDISLRYVIPIYPFLLLYLMRVFEKCLNYFSKNKFAFYLIIICFSVFPVEKGVKHTIINYSNGINDFSSKKWSESGTIKYINSNLREAKIYSNSVAGIYSNTMLESSDVYEINRNNIQDRNIIIILFDNNLPGISKQNFSEILFNKPDSVIVFPDSKIYIINK